MMTALVLLLFVSLAFIDSFATELRMIQVIFRHGDRAPTTTVAKIYPLDPYANETWYPEGWGGLTNVGKRRAYELGLFLRSRYGDWLGNEYLNQTSQFRSSNVDRVIMSTQLLAAGLYPPDKLQRWNRMLDWQPIPVHLISDSKNILYKLKFTCPKYKAIRNELENTDEYLVRRAENLTDFFRFLSKNVGTKVGQQEATAIYEQLYAEMGENVELPEWTKGIFPNGKLRDVAGYDYVIQSYNESMIQLNGGRHVKHAILPSVSATLSVTRVFSGQWIREWLKNVDDYLDGSSQSENHIGFYYGGHEYNVAAILAALGVFEPHVPYYSSAVIFELSKIDDEYFVKVLYRNRGNLRKIRLPNCQSFDCPLVTFRELYSDVILDDPYAFC
ncbi:venom acid phosphatase Acph-1-like [Diprion similis]|uniref:venom acid phosphatase Acph-1-like n=1 Tax=Diprion similis TaxID=362088 RepID=UPI001EF76806|nr:venom acid phosphatase Acph-1-like [Diprion similis]